MSDHLAFTCTMRRVLCHFCCKEFSGEEMEDHAGACNQEPIYCETKCGSKILRGRMSSHKAKDCVKRLIKCEYCQKDFIADTIPLHQNTCLQKQQQQQQLQPLKVSLSPCRRSSLDELNNNNITSCDISNQNQISCFFRDAGCKFRGTQTHLDHHLDSNNSSHLLLMVQHAEKQKQQIEMLKKTITKLSTNYSGTLLWKITNWEKRMSEAKRNESLELVSPAFYTSQYGYKLQVSIFLNGNGPGESTHMSVFIKILPGEYDALLKWPFNQKVTFTLFEQSTEHDNVQGGIAESFIPDPMWKNFQTPSESAQDLGFGFPCFVSHDTLARRPFVRNDTVFLRVKCEPNKIVAVWSEKTSDELQRRRSSSHVRSHKLFKTQLLHKKISFIFWEKLLDIFLEMQGGRKLSFLVFRQTHVLRFKVSLYPTFSLNRIAPKAWYSARNEFEIEEKL